MRRWALLLVLAACGDRAAAPDASTCAGVPAPHVLAIEPQVGDLLALPDDIAVDSNNVYWVDYWHDTVRTIPKPGGTATTVVRGEAAPRRIAVDDANVYWVNDDGTLRAADKTTGTARTLFTETSCPLDYHCVDAIAADPDALYWISGEPAKVYRRTHSDGAVTVLGTSTLGSLALDGSFVYFTSVVVDSKLESALQRVPKTGGPVENVYVVDYQEASVGDITLDEQNVYFSLLDSIGAVSVWAAPKNGGAPFELGPMPHAKFLASDGTFIFATTGSEVVAMSITTGAVVSVACGQMSSEHIVYDSTNVYWNDERAQIVTAPKP